VRRDDPIKRSRNDRHGSIGVSPRAEHSRNMQQALNSIEWRMAGISSGSVTVPCDQHTAHRRIRGLLLVVRQHHARTFTPLNGHRGRCSRRQRRPNPPGRSSASAVSCCMLSRCMSLPDFESHIPKSSDRWFPLTSGRRLAHAATAGGGVHSKRQTSSSR